MSEQELNLIIAQNITDYMQKRNLTQQDVADAVGVTQATVSNWCLGIKSPRMNKIDKLCELFGCKRSELLDVAKPKDDDTEIHNYAQELKDNPKYRLLMKTARELNEEDFEDKMARLTSELSDMFAKSHELEDEIRRKLGAIGYEI